MRHFLFSATRAFAAACLQIETGEGGGVSIFFGGDKMLGPGGGGEEGYEKNPHKFCSVRRQNWGLGGSAVHNFFCLRGIRFSNP